jgi:hypothetical protein
VCAPLRSAKTVAARGSSATVSPEQALEDVLLAHLRRWVPCVLDVVLREAVTESRETYDWRAASPRASARAAAWCAQIEKPAARRLRLMRAVGSSTLGTKATPVMRSTASM